MPAPAIIKTKAVIQGHFALFVLCCDDDSSMVSIRVSHSIIYLELIPSLFDIITQHFVEAISLCFELCVEDEISLFVRVVI